MQNRAISEDVMRGPLFCYGLLYVRVVLLIEDSVFDVTSSSLLSSSQGLYAGWGLIISHGAGRRGDPAMFLLGRMNKTIHGTRG